ncbi:SLC13 family permease [Microbacterium sp.]|uniref:SLC13 family permease n=1 Tax=Microbacterium sp. TaxID=51671 RepID=UPI003F962031
MVLLMVTGVVPNVIAALIACVLMGIFRWVDMPSAYRSIHWPTLLLIVEGLLGAYGDSGPTVLLAVFFALTALIGIFVSNTATAVFMAPLAIGAATELGASPLPFAMIVALAASCAFMTPVSSPVNTLGVEPGGYRFGDFVRVGAPFTLIAMIVSVLLVPVLLPLY